MLVDRKLPPPSLRRLAQKSPRRLHRLTALSGARDSGSLLLGALRAVRGLARRSLGPCSLVLGLPGCLVTADPVSYEPAQTPPIIVSSGLDPDPRDILLIGGDMGVGRLDFTASVLSEDAGESVKVRLYIDYGMPINEESIRPFRFSWAFFSPLPPATLAEGARPLGEDVEWVDGNFPLQPGCHRLTLIVSHEFEDTTGCPKDLNDSSQITWQFRQCGLGECLPILEDCPSTDATCPLAP
jgi:hypothetical protein